MNQQNIIIQTRNANIGQQEGPPPISLSSPPTLPGLATQLHDLAHHLLLLGPVYHLRYEENEEGRGEWGFESANYWTDIVEAQTPVYMTFHYLLADLLKYSHVPVLEHVELLDLKEHGH